MNYEQSVKKYGGFAGQPARDRIEKPTLTVGSKAFVDAFAGLIPCVVLAIEDRAIGTNVTSKYVTVRLTAGRGAYKRGETLTFSALAIVPREAVHVRSGQYVIRQYSVELPTP